MPRAEPRFIVGWHRLLQEAELARHYPHPYMLDAGGSVSRNPLLEGILPSLLYIKMACLLDDGLRQIIRREGLSTKGYRDSLGDRIKLLAEEGLLRRRERADAIRKRRNELAHEADGVADWSELETALSAAHQELQHLGLVGDRPAYDFYAERSAVRATDRRDAIGEWSRSFGLRRDGRVVIEFSSVEHLLRDSP